MSRFAIDHPYLIVVLFLIVTLLGMTTLVRMPVDLFPPINIPVVVVATFYSGMPPEQIETDITGRFERFFTLGSDIDHMESRSLPGVSLIKIYFHAGSDPNSALSQISNLALANLRRLPPGTLPPVVLKFDASSLPVCLVTLKGEGLNETQLRDLGQFAVRNQIAGVPGASIPPPFGGKYRQIMVYVDPLKLEARQLSVMDVVRGVNDSNLILPAGDVKIGPIDYNLYTNSQLPTIGDIDRLPLKTVNGAPVLVQDIGKAEDGHQIQTSIVRVDGQRSVYLPVLKQGGNTNTIAVVDGVKRAVADLRDIPRQLISRVVFDQSIFVRKAIENLLHEGAIGLILTGLMILLFLGSMRATIAVFLSIPLSALAAFLILGLAGGTVNTMVLGGLALAFSRLIDNSVVVLENIFRHMEMGESVAEAAEKGGAEVAFPVLAATLTTIVVFLPVVFLYGVSRFLFTALALGVALSLLASFFVAMTIVPLFCARFLRRAHLEEDHVDTRSGFGRFIHRFNHRFEQVLDRYGRVLGRTLGRPAATVVGIVGVCLLSFSLTPLLHISFFPRTDPGQFVVNLKAPSGTRIEIAEAYVQRVEEAIRKVVPEDERGIVVSNIGSTPGFSSIYTPNSAPHTAFVQVSLKEGHKIGSYEYMSRVRDRLRQDVPELSTYFQSGGLVDAVLNLGLPAPIDVQVSGANLEETYRVAMDIAGRVRKLSGVGDSLVPQDIDNPALRLDIDRTKASLVGLSQKEVVDNLITALSSNQMIAPSYWVDPKSGNDYMLTVQYPESTIHSLSDLKQIPLRSANGANPTQLDAVVGIQPILSPTEVDHYQLQRVIDVYVAPKGEDLGKLARRIDDIVTETRLPAGVRVNVRGSVQAMRASFKSFAFGLILSVALVYLILVAQFSSFKDPLIILLAIPPGLVGVLAILLLWGSSLNVMSLMGVVMMVGIVVSNSILIVDFARTLLGQGVPLKDAVAQACRIRLRPILMTSLATIIGLVPMAMKLGTGAEPYAPLAQAIIGGLLVSVVATVFLVPAAYLLVHSSKTAPAESRS